MNKYRQDLDVLKGMAIIAVVLYHLGLLKSGYLGVDLFLVINGYLIIPSVCKQVANGDFCYWSFLRKRIMRLLPLIVLATACCLVWGFISMLPDDYENLSEYVIASNILSGNIMSAISSKNYWAAFNEYKPLMHMWYVGVIFEFYLTFPLIFWLANKLKIKCMKNNGKNANLIFTNCLLIFLFFLSLFMYLSHIVPGHKFYHVHFRYFEFLAGGFVGMNIQKIQNKNPFITIFTNLLLFLTICIGIFTFDIHSLGGQQVVIGAPNIVRNLLLPNHVLVLLTVVLSSFVLSQDNYASRANQIIFNNRFLAWLGKMSFSIFVWHQIVIAFYRYSFTSKITVLSLVLYLLFIVFLSWITYSFIEQKITITSKTTWITFIADVIVCIVAGLIYINGGVVRDVPEIDAYVHNAQRGMHIAYCDRIYKYDKDFPVNGKPNVLVIGNSFSRDMCNIILESAISDKINLSYIYKLKESYISRIAKADKILIFMSKEKVPDYLWNSVRENVQVWGIGTKSFGVSNGAIYWNRNKPWYFDQTVPVNPGVIELNRQWKSQWGDQFIDLMELVMVDGNRVRVFSPQHKFISPDCEHLVKGGAQYYASLLDFDDIFNDIVLAK